MTTISVRWADDHLKKFGKQIDELNRRFPKVLPRIINQVGARAKTQVIRKLTAQTGLPRKTIVKAVQVTASGGKKRSYDMVTRGGQVRLKYLSPRETRPGVVAKPFGKRKLFPSTFMKGGAFPNRKMVVRFDGHVYRRLGYGKRTDGTFGAKLTQVRSNVVIPNEMTTGATAAAFQKIAGPLLQQRVEAAIKKLLV